MTHTALPVSQDSTVPMDGHLEHACALLFQHQQHQKVSAKFSSHQDDSETTTTMPEEDSTPQRPILSITTSPSIPELSADVNKTIEETALFLRGVIGELKSKAPSPITKDDQEPRSPGHPLIMDEEDVERVVAANLRLLQGLKKKIDEVVELERRLKEKERSSASQSSVNLDGEEIRVVPIHAATAPVSPQATQMQLSAFPPPSSRKITIETHARHAVTDDEGEDDRVPVVWTPEMEAELKRLELSLRQANKNWSDEQEEVLEPLERLRDLKRRHKKLTRSQSVGVGKGASNVKVSMVNLKKTLSFSRSETNSLFNFNDDQKGVDGKKVGKLLKAIKKRVF